MSILHRISSPYTALSILRIGLSLVIIWFGFQQVSDPASWIGWVPGWVSDVPITARQFIIYNGIFEIVAGFLFTIGVYRRIVAWILFIHMVLIVIHIGITPIGVRDAGLAVGFLSLGLASRK